MNIFMNYFNPLSSIGAIFYLPNSAYCTGQWAGVGGGPAFYIYGKHIGFSACIIGALLLNAFGQNILFHFYLVKSPPPPPFII
jgi:hypothetical protein